MTPEDKMLNLLGLALRAGKLITGEEMTIKSIQKNEAVFVLCATDCSTNTKEKLENKCRYYEVPFLVHFTSEQISQAIVKSRSICALTDRGFAKSFMRLKGTK